LRRFFLRLKYDVLRLPVGRQVKRSKIPILSLKHSPLFEKIIHLKKILYYCIVPKKGPPQYWGYFRSQKNEIECIIFHTGYFFKEKRRGRVPSLDLYFQSDGFVQITYYMRHWSLRSLVARILSCTFIIFALWRKNDERP
jgi:hypothetical protein